MNYRLVWFAMGFLTGAVVAAVFVALAIGR